MLKEVPIARYLRLAFGGSLTGMAMVALPAFAQTSTTGSDAVVQQGERVEVTGSSIKRIDAESGSPLQVITREDIQRLAPQNTEELLRSVSATNSIGNVVTASGAGATTGGLSSVSLRGLGSSRTLVLVNGRRVSTFGGLAGGGGASAVDINSIPVAAIERVEVLKDGASAIYGSDAIAGVINFILRSDYTGALVESQYGQTTHAGDGRSYSSDAVVGFGDLQKDRFNVMLTAAFEKDQAIYGSQRGYADSSVTLNGLNDYTSSNTYPSNIFIKSGSYRNFLAPTYAPLVANGTYPTFGFTNCSPSQVDPVIYGTSRCRYSPAALVPLIPDQRRSSVGFNGQFAITPSITAYLDANASRIITKYSEQASPISQAVGSLPKTNPYYAVEQAQLAGPIGAAINSTYGTGGVINSTSLLGESYVLLPTTSPYYPTAFATSLGLNGAPLLLTYRSIEAGGRQIRDESTSGRVVTGIKGSAFNWDYDLGLIYAASKLNEYDVGGYELYSKILPLLASGVVNPFGPSTPAAQAAIQNTVYHGEAYDSKTQFSSINGHASRDIYNLPAGPLSIAVGGDVRHEAYRFEASAAYQVGDITGYGGNGIGIDKSRNVEAGFVELTAPIIKGLDLDLAGRFDNYEYVGNTFNPKATLRWQPVKQFLARASIGTGFRAPALDELYAPITTGVSSEYSDPIRCPAEGAGGPDCNKQFNTLNGGNPNLQPEKSTSLTYGFQIEPTDNVHFGVDYFDIKLRNTIVIGGVTIGDILDSVADAQKYSYLLTRGPADAFGPGPIIAVSQQNLNLYKQHVRGLDFDLKLRAPLAYGRVTAALNGTYFLSDDYQGQDGSYEGVIANAEALGGVLPRWKHIASLTYDYGPYSGSVIQNFQSAYLDYPDDGSGNTRRVGVYETFDLQASYTGIKNLKLTLGVKNVFDKDPPYSNVGGGFYFQSGYDPSYADPHGRFVYARVGYEFK
jgi:iron complex outermembrane receptor protein